MADFDPLVEWVLPERQSADSCVGPARIRRFWEQLDEHMDELQLLPQEYVEAGDRVATRLRHRGLGKGSGVELDQELYHQVITFRDGSDGAASSTSPSGTRRSRRPAFLGEADPYRAGGRGK